MAQKKYSKNLVDSVTRSFVSGDYKSGFVNLVRSLYYHDLLDFRTAQLVLEAINSSYGDRKCLKKQSYPTITSTEIIDAYNSAFDFQR